MSLNLSNSLFDNLKLDFYDFSTGTGIWDAQLHLHVLCAPAEPPGIKGTKRSPVQPGPVLMLLLLSLAAIF